MITVYSIINLFIKKLANALLEYVLLFNKKNILAFNYAYAENQSIRYMIVSNLK